MTGTHGPSGHPGSTPGVGVFRSEPVRFPTGMTLHFGVSRRLLVWAFSKLVRPVGTSGEAIPSHIYFKIGWGKLLLVWAYSCYF